MKRQDLNLFDGSLLPERRWLTLPTVLVGAVVVWGLTYGGALWLNRLTAQHLGRAAQAQTEMRQLAQQPAVAAVQEQKAAIQQLRDRLVLAQAFERQLATLPTSDAAPQVLEGLAHASLPDVWVTALRWDAREPQLEIDGRLLEAARLPAYLRRLEQQPGFKGQRLSQVRVTGAADSAAGPTGFQIKGQAGKVGPR